MSIFKLSPPKTVRLFSGHILSRNATHFPHSQLDFKNFPGGETPGPQLMGAGKGRGGDGKGLKGSYL